MSDDDFVLTDRWKTHFGALQTVPMIARRVGNRLYPRFVLTFHQRMKNLAFMAAVLSGDLETVNAELSSGSIDVNARIQGDTPLYFAVRNGRTAIAAALLDAGAHIDNDPSNGQTMVHLSVVRKHADVLELLISRGADATRPDLQNRKPLDIAVELSHERMVLALINAGAPLDNPDTLTRAAAISAVIGTRLMEQNVDLKELRDSTGRTPCHFAVHNVLDFLVNTAGVDFNACDNQRRSPCHTAASSDSDPALRELIKRGADFDEPDASGCTPLHLSCHGDGLCTASLVAAGARIDALTDLNNMQPVHFAASGSSPIPLSVLLAMGADLDAPDVGGNTARQTATVFSLPLPSADALAVMRLVCSRARDADLLCTPAAEFRRTANVRSAAFRVPRGSRRYISLFVDDRHNGQTL
jgi:ankyrin repeat protein